MTEDDAQAWLSGRSDVSRETIARLTEFTAFLRREAASQNLISASTLDQIWSRHIVDSAQLLNFVDQQSSDIRWLDLGTGAGFPGLVVAIMSNCQMTLVESRARRVDYLQRAVAMLDLSDRVQVAGVELHRLETAPYSVISARAFAPLPKLFQMAKRFATNNTLWLLPKGRNAKAEWEETQKIWDGNFRVDQSITDPEAGILVGTLSEKRLNSVRSGQEGQEP